MKYPLAALRRTSLNFENFTCIYDCKFVWSFSAHQNEIIFIYFNLSICRQIIRYHLHISWWISSIYPRWCIWRYLQCWLENVRLTLKITEPNYFYFILSIQKQIIEHCLLILYYDKCLFSCGRLYVRVCCSFGRKCIKSFKNR